jgi:hypothetical protein
MSEEFLVGAILGSALFIFAGRRVADRLLAVVRAKVGGRR